MATLDGFGSHVTTPLALEVFYKNKIHIVKEEGDTSHVAQPFDRQVAKSDKKIMRTALESLRAAPSWTGGVIQADFSCLAGTV